MKIDQIKVELSINGFKYRVFKEFEEKTSDNKAKIEKLITLINNKKPFGDLLRGIIEDDLKMSQREFATELNLDRKHNYIQLNKWINNKARPNKTNIKKIEKILNKYL